MKNQKRIAMVVIAFGLVIGLVGIFADVVGLGKDEDTFGTLQILATVIGIVILLAGVAFHRYGGRFLGSKTKEKGTGAGEQ